MVADILDTFPDVGKKDLYPNSLRADNKAGGVRAP